jgi:hypothetical protein
MNMIFPDFLKLIMFLARSPGTGDRANSIPSDLVSIIYCLLLSLVKVLRTKLSKIWIEAEVKQTPIFGIFFLGCVITHHFTLLTMVFDSRKSLTWIFLKDSPCRGVKDFIWKEKKKPWSYHTVGLSWVTKLQGFLIWSFIPF